MRRRAVLRGGLVLAGLGGAAVGSASGSTETGRDDRSRSFGPIASRSIPGAADCRVSTDGDVAYVAVGDGFVAVELPTMDGLASRRSIEADRSGGPLADIADVAVDGDRLLVPGPAHRRPGRLAGFALFDVGDPSRPVQVAFHETTFPIHNAALADGRAYLTAERSMVVVDLTDDDPVEVGRWSLADVDPRWDDVPLPLRVLHDIRVRGDLAVLSQWDAGTWLIDVADLDEVSVVGRAGGRSLETLASIPSGDLRAAAIGLPGNHHSAALAADGSLLAVGAEAFAVEAPAEGTTSPPGSDGSDRSEGDGGRLDGPGGIDLYDLADPASPALVASIDPPRAADETRTGTWTTAHDFAFDGDRLLSAWYQGGVRVHDVSRPAAPRELAWWRRPDEVAFWTARPAAADTFVASSTALPDPSLRAGVYLFPNRPGTQTDPPSLVTPLSPATARSPTATSAPAPTETTGQPGYNLLSALGGLAGLAAWRRWRSR